MSVSGRELEALPASGELGPGFAGEGETAANCFGIKLRRQLTHPPTSHSPTAANFTNYLSPRGNLSSRAPENED